MLYCCVSTRTASSAYFHACHLVSSLAGLRLSTKKKIQYIYIYIQSQREESWEEVGSLLDVHLHLVDNGELHGALSFLLLLLWWRQLQSYILTTRKARKTLEFICSKALLELPPVPS